MRLFLILGALNGFIGVALGAFGAHGLEGEISEDAIAIWEKAVQYQMYHTAALLAVGLLFAKVKRASLTASGWFFFIGIILFSGTLYAYNRHHLFRLDYTIRGGRFSDWLVSIWLYSSEESVKTAFASLYN